MCWHELTRCCCCLKIRSGVFLIAGVHIAILAIVMAESVVQVSISLTFYTRLFYTKVFCAAVLELHFSFVIFWQNNIVTKAARKVLMKLTTVWLSRRGVIAASFLQTSIAR
jgi:hypothetical protein